MMHENSVNAYRTSKHDKRISEILADMRKHGPGTAREIKERMGLADMNEIRPRLCDMGMGEHKRNLVVEVGRKRCPVTGKTVSVFGLAQQPLPIPEVAPVIGGTRSALFNACVAIAKGHNDILQLQQPTFGF